MTANEPRVIYQSSRLAFIYDKIEPLRREDAFRVLTPHGIFQMTKEEFYRDFSNVVESRSYRMGTPGSKRSGGYYHYHYIPSKADKYRIDKQPAPRKRRRGRPAFARPVSDDERRFLEEGSKSPEPLVRKRCQVLLASLRGERLKEIAANAYYSYHTVQVIVRDFNEEGLSSIWRYKRKPRTSGESEVAETSSASSRTRRST